MGKTVNVFGIEMQQVSKEEYLKLQIRHSCQGSDERWIFPKFMPVHPGIDLPPGFKKIDDTSAELVSCPFCGKTL